MIGVFDSGHGGLTILRALTARFPGHRYIFSSIGHAEIHTTDPSIVADSASEDETILRSPMPGKIVAVLADASSRVKKGETLLVIEAMKMEHSITATANGVVTDIHCKLGDTVGEDAVLIELALD